MDTKIKKTEHETEIELLKDILDDGCREAPHEVSVSGFRGFFLKESASDAKLRKVEILVPEGVSESLALYPEKGQGKDKRFSPLLSRSPKTPHNQVCDAVIFCTDGNKHYLLLCELKSDNPSGYKNQFKATESFLNYVFSLLNEFRAHTRVNRITLRVVFNTRKTTFQTVDKKVTMPRKAPNTRDQYKLIRVQNDQQIHLSGIIH